MDTYPIHLNILVGTMTNTALLVAQEIELSYGDEQLIIRVQEMAGLSVNTFHTLPPTTFPSHTVWLICSSTYGQGDVPDNAKDFYASLMESNTDLSAISYGVIALGDRTYLPTFCFGGKKFDERLAQLGAHRIGAICTHDASAGTLPEEVCMEWVGTWLEEVRHHLSERATEHTN